MSENAKDAFVDKRLESLLIVVKMKLHEAGIYGEQYAKVMEVMNYSIEELIKTITASRKLQ